MTTYTVRWKIEIEAEDIGEARRKHTEALEMVDDAPCSVYVWGDGPKEDRGGISAEEAAANIAANAKDLADT